VLFPVDPLSSAVEIVSLVTVRSLQYVSLHNTHQQVSFQTGFTVTDCIPISFCLAVIRFSLPGAVVRRTSN
jgi:hypothetical protein